MPNVTLACQFCQTLNKIDAARFADKPKCAECERPFLLDRPVKVLEEHFDQTVLKSELPVVVDFYADWCGPCKVMAPYLDEIARDKAGQILIAKVDTDRSPEVSRRYNIKGIPFFARFEDGEVVKTLVGVVGKEALQELAAEMGRGERE
jgi:thioredoxin 2